MNTQLRSVTFKSGGIDIAADLRLPQDSGEGMTHAAIVLVTPGSSVKGQIGANYAQRLSERGFVTITFDPSYQGESSGEPRDLESPAARMEDVRCAVDYLMTLPCVAEERIGVLGICAGGGYAIGAAMTEHRLKAVATVVAVDIGRAFRQAQPSPGALAKMLEEVGKQRTIEARGGPQRREPWIPDTLEAAEAAGIADRDVLDAVNYYRTPRGFDANATNRLLFRSNGLIIGFDPFSLVGELLAQPLMVIVGGRLGTTFSYADGLRLFERAPNAKEFFVVENAGHYEMYDTAAYVDQAVGRLAPFFDKHLNARAEGAANQPTKELTAR